VEDKCASFANIIVDVTPDSDLLNIVDEKSTSVIVVTVNINFILVTRNYEVGDLQMHMIVKLV